jgi:glycerol uptake facilitator-like aquaporin
METFFRLTLFAAGIINLLPSILAFAPKKITKSYGVAVPDANYELLLRHRAVLFGIVGGIMVYSAASSTLYQLAMFVGVVSMAAFIVLYYATGRAINPALTKVMRIDAKYSPTIS